MPAEWKSSKPGSARSTRSRTRPDSQRVVIANCTTSVLRCRSRCRGSAGPARSDVGHGRRHAPADRPARSRLLPQARAALQRSARKICASRCQRCSSWPAGDQKTATAAAATVMAIETKLAEASLDNVALRDPSSDRPQDHLHPTQAMAPHFDWAAYFDTAKLPQDVDLNVDQPKFVQEVRPPVAADADCGLEDVSEVAGAELGRRPLSAAVRGRRTSRSTAST